MCVWGVDAFKKKKKKKIACTCVCVCVCVRAVRVSVWVCLGACKQRDGPSAHLHWWGEHFHQKKVKSAKQSANIWHVSHTHTHTNTNTHTHKHTHTILTSSRRGGLARTHTLCNTTFPGASERTRWQRDRDEKWSGARGGYRVRERVCSQWGWITWKKLVSNLFERNTS